MTSKRVTTALVITGGAVTTRLVGGGILALAAHRLELLDFGRFAIAFAVAGGIGAIAGSGLFDSLTYRAWDQAQHRHLVRSIRLACVVGSIFLLLPLPAHSGIWVSTLVVGLTSTLVVPLAAVHRGNGALVRASLLLHWIPIVSRVAAVLAVTEPTPSGLIEALGWGAIAAGFIGSLPGMGRVRSHSSRPQARTLLATAVALSTAWTVLSQADVLLLGLVRGEASVGIYVPQMRLYEAYTAITSAVVFGVSEQLRMRDSNFRASRIYAFCIALYVLVAAAALPFTPVARDWLFAGRGDFALATAAIFTVGYSLSAPAAIRCQQLIAEGNHHRVMAASILASISSVLLVLLTVSTLGALGAALGNALGYATFLLLLSTQRPD